MTIPNKVDSNFSGLSFAEELSIGVLPTGTLTDGTVLPVWYGLEPNSYKDFGAQITTAARNPINQTRQRRKGSVTDLVASGGFTSDLTADSLPRLMQGFMYADAREKRQTAPLHLCTQGAYPVSAVTTALYDVASPTFVAGDLLLAEGFTNSSNNGLKVATAAAAGVSVSAAGLVAETPTTAAKLTVVGVQFASGDVSITNSGSLPTLSSTPISGKDLTTLGLVPGEWIYLGGDTSGVSFATAVNNCFARVYSISTNQIVFDKTENEMVTDAGTGKTIQMFFGTVIKNESTPSLIKRRTYHIERTLGNLGQANQAVEYLIGAVPNEMVLAVKSASTVTVDTTFMAINTSIDDGTVGPLSGTRVASSFLDVINTASDFSRMNISVVSSTDASITPLFAYITDMNLTIKNNDKDDKAVGVLGAFDITTGSFELTATVTAYFNSAAAVTAVRANPDVTVDFVAVKNQRGIVIDIPKCSLGGGRLNVVQDTAIMVPVTPDAGVSNFGHTMMFGWFQYLPLASEG